MGVAALITWLITAVGGFVLLGTWLTKRGSRGRPGRSSRLSPGVVFSHLLLAAVGLVLWIVYLAADSDGLTWVAFVLVALAAVRGFTMFFRWLPQRRAAATRATEPTAEAAFPVPVVVLHGLFAAATLVLVLIAAVTA